MIFCEFIIYDNDNDKTLTIEINGTCGIFSRLCLQKKEKNKLSIYKTKEIRSLHIYNPNYNRWQDWEKKKKTKDQEKLWFIIISSLGLWNRRYYLSMSQFVHMWIFLFF